MNAEDRRERERIGTWLEAYAALSFGSTPLMSEQALWEGNRSYQEQAPTPQMSEIIFPRMRENSTGNRAQRLGRPTYYAR